MTARIIGIMKSTLMHNWSLSLLMSASRGLTGIPKPTPMEKGTRIPKVIQICDKAPAGPFTSTGETSLMNFGQKHENPPQATPYKNLPMRKA